MNSTDTPIESGTGVGISTGVAGMASVEGWLGDQHKVIEGWGGV